MRVGLSKRSAGGFTAPSRSPASASSSSSGKKEKDISVVKSEPAKSVAAVREAATPKKRAVPEEDEAPQEAEALPAVKREKRDSVARSPAGEPWECAECGGGNVEFQDACEFCDAARNRKHSSFEVAANVLKKQQQLSSEAESLRREDSVPSPTRARVSNALAGVKGALSSELTYAMEVAMWAKNNPSRRLLLDVALAALMAPPPFPELETPMPKKSVAASSAAPNVTAPAAAAVTRQPMPDSLFLIEDDNEPLVMMKKSSTGDSKRDNCSQELVCYLKPVDVKTDPTICVSCDRDVTFGRHEHLRGLTDNRFCVSDPKVSQTHCRIAIRNDTEIWLTDSSTNGTYLQLGDQRLISKKESAQKPAEHRLHVGDFFALCTAGPDSVWKHVWQVCRTENEAVTAVVPRQKKELDLVSSDKSGRGGGGIGNKKKRAAPTPESMAKVEQDVNDGEAALAKVLAEASKRKPVNKGPQVVAKAKTKKKKEDDEEVSLVKEPAKKSMKELIVERKKSTPASVANAAESIVIGDDNEDDDSAFFKAPKQEPDSSVQRNRAPSISFSLSLGN